MKKFIVYFLLGAAVWCGLLFGVVLPALASPCQIREVTSGGMVYKTCYDWGWWPPRKVALTYCIYHTGPCR